MACKDQGKYTNHERF